MSSYIRPTRLASVNVQEILRKNHGVKISTGKLKKAENRLAKRDYTLFIFLIKKNFNGEQLKRGRGRSVEKVLMVRISAMTTAVCVCSTVSQISDIQPQSKDTSHARHTLTQFTSPSLFRMLYRIVQISPLYSLINTAFSLSLARSFLSSDEN